MATKKTTKKKAKIVTSGGKTTKVGSSSKNTSGSSNSFKAKDSKYQGLFDQASKIQAGINKVASSKGVKLVGSGTKYKAVPTGDDFDPEMYAEGAGSFESPDFAATNQKKMDDYIAGIEMDRQKAEKDQAIADTSGKISENKMLPTGVSAPTAQPVGAVKASATPTGVTPGLGGVSSMSSFGGGMGSNYQAGLAAAQASGMPAPTDIGRGMAGANKFLSQANASSAPSMLDSYMDEDPFLNQMTMAYQEYFNPKNQRMSLSQEYNKLLKKSGLEALDTELMNTKNIIDGSEDDIRNEVTKAGGFATDSQVLALTGARNKQLVKNYNTLLETRNSKSEYLNTQIGLMQQDRAEADQRFDRMFNMGTQIMQYRDKMRDNAVNGFNNIVNRVGYEGLAAMTQGNPYYQSLIEKTLGLGEGGLQQLANRPMSESDQLDLDLKRAQLRSLNAPAQDPLLSIDEAQKLGVPYGTTQSQAFGKTPGGGIDPVIGKTRNENFAATESARSTVNGILSRIRDGVTIDNVTEEDLKGLDNASAEAIGAAMFLARNPASAKTGDIENALNATSILGKGKQFFKGKFTGKKYTASDIMGAINVVKDIYDQRLSEVGESGYLGGFDAPDGSGDTIILTD